MKCPYCTEEIPGDAKFCRYCRHDLSLILSLMLDNQQLQEKIASLEYQISQLSASLDDPHKEGQATPAMLPAELSTDAADKSSIDEPKWQQLVLPVLLSSLSWPVLYAFIWFGGGLQTLAGGLQTQNYLTTEMGGFIWFLFPLGCGIWAGLRWQGKRLRDYVSLWLSVFLVHLASGFGFQYLILVFPVFSISLLVMGLGFVSVQTLLLVLAAFATAFWIRVGLTERVHAIATERGRITLAILLPVLFWLLFGIFYSIPFGNYNPIFFLPIVLFLCALLISPLVSGFWVGLSWPRRHLMGYSLLGLITGVLANIGLLVGEEAWWRIHKLSLSERLTSVGVWNTISVVFLFLAGGLFADLIKNKTNPHLISERGFAYRVTAKFAGPGKEPSREAIQRVQLLVPTLLTISGVVVNLLTIVDLSTKIAGI